ncbi:hypothetical protein C5167_022301 [Papaver somniferum]|uniref:Uncharacterized protein n=1 Tax=Papaver somniferum TaxID=3469 RepID=A0A4Y7JKL3_PAPSO|nr:hypothetical protein C5167_022301 [Papaver somniferum]
MEALSVDFLKKIEQFTQQPANLGYLGNTTKVEAQLEITLFFKGTSTSTRKGGLDLKVIVRFPVFSYQENELHL